MPRRLTLTFLCLTLPLSVGCLVPVPSVVKDAAQQGDDSSAQASTSQANDDGLSIPSLEPKPLIWLEERKASQGEEESASRKLARRVNSLADQLKALERYEQAEKQYQEAMKTDPTWSFPPYQLACNYELWGKHDLAVPQFAKAMELGFDDFPTALTDDELGLIRKGPTFEDNLRQIRERYIKASAERVGEPIAVRPSGSKPAGGWPVMMLLHGYGDSNTSYLDNAKAWAKLGFVAIAVPGSVPASKDRFMWADDSTEPTHRDLSKALASAKLDGVVNRERVYLLGFSQGALHALLLTAAHPEEFKGVVALSPGGSLARQLVQPVLQSSGVARCMFIHGDEEAHAPLAEIWAGACARQGWKFATRTHNGGHHFPADWETTRAEVAAFLVE